MSRISVIIPAYNAVRTIDGCLASVKRDDVEVIVVDDGSTDGTSERVKAYPGVRLVVRENGGVSAARNTGISVATGEYLVFLDSDDVLMENALERLHAALEADAPDVVVMRSFCGSSERYPWASRFRDGAICSGDEIVRAGYLRGSVCGCAFRKAFLTAGNLFFPEGVPLSEDLVFFSQCIAEKGRFLFKDILFYQICEREDSASRKMDENYIRRYSMALPAALERISDPALLSSTCLSIILGMVHVAAPAGYSPGRLRKEARIDAVLPLPVEQDSPDKGAVRLLNASFTLFFRIKQLYDLCRHR